MSSPPLYFLVLFSSFPQFDYVTWTVPFLSSTEIYHLQLIFLLSRQQHKRQNASSLLFYYLLKNIKSEKKQKNSQRLVVQQITWKQFLIPLRNVVGGNPTTGWMYSTQFELQSIDQRAGSLVKLANIRRFNWNEKSALPPASLHFSAIELIVLLKDQRFTTTEIDQSVTLLNPIRPKSK